MDVQWYSEAVPGGRNEDYVLTGMGWAVVLDGATARADVESGCIHDVPWLVGHLARHLGGPLAADDPRPLTEILRDAIQATMNDHGETCDLTNPDSPSSTVSIVRIRPGAVECLCLADSPILLRYSDRLELVADDRTAHLPSYTVASIRKLRNSVEGFWVASNNPEAASHAVVQRHETDELRSVYMLTDGASRYVEKFALGKWDDAAAILDQSGPSGLVALVREHERALDREYYEQPNGRPAKPHDDASVVTISFRGSGLA